MSKLITGDAQLSNPEVMAVLRQLARERFADTMTDLNTNLEAARFDRERTQQLVREAESSAPSHIAVANGSQPDDFHYQLARLSLKKYIQDPDPETVSYLVKLWAQAQLEANRILVAKVTGKFTEAKVMDELFQGVDTLAVHPQPEEIDGELYVPRSEPRYHSHTAPQNPSSVAAAARAVPLESIDKALETYTTQKRGKGRDDKTVNDIIASLKLFQLICPDIKNVTDITKAHILDFESKLSLIPATYSRSKDLKILPFEALVKAGAGLPKFSPASCDKHSINVRAFIRWLQEVDKLPVIKLPKLEALDKLKGEEKRNPFSEDELAKILHSPQYQGHRPDGVNKHRTEEGGVITMDAYYWVPLIGLYSGMRLSEILQLYPSDIKVEGGIPYFDVNEESPDKSLKNATSKRQIPIHPMLIKLGFLNFVEDIRRQGHTRIFHDIEKGPDGRYSHNFSKYFGRFLIMLELKRPEISFHSFRHTFITLASRQKGIRDDMIDALVGHKNKTTSSIYRGKYTLAEKLEALSVIVYPYHIISKLKPYKGS